MKYADYLREVEGFSEESVDRLMKDAQPSQKYYNYCRENGLKFESYEDIFWSDRW